VELFLNPSGEIFHSLASGHTKVSWLITVITLFVQHGANIDKSMEYSKMCFCPEKIPPGFKESAHEGGLWLIDG
jgi:hypothetical protein